MTMITPSYLGETIEYSSLHACRSTLEDPTAVLWRMGSKRALSTVGMIGPVEATWPASGDIRLRSKVILLGDAKPVGMNRGENPNSGTLCFANWNLASVISRTPEVLVTSSFLDSTILATFHYHGTGSPPEWCDVDLLWQGNTSPAQARIPFPAAGARCFDAKGRHLVNESVLAAESVFGVRIVAFLDNRAHATLRFILWDGKHEADSASVPMIAPLGSNRIEIRLVDHLPRIRRMLASADALDSFVSVELDAGRFDAARLRIARYSSELSKDSQTGTVSLLQTSRSGLCAEDVPKLNAQAIRLDAACEEPLMLAPFDVSSPGIWSFPADCLDPGPWLIYPAKGSPVLFRPILWTIKSNEKTPSYAITTSLSSVANITDPHARLEALQAAIHSLALDFDHSDWSIVEQLASELYHLPLCTLDVWRAFSRLPEGVTALALRTGGLPTGFFERFSSEMPCVWETIPLNVWVESMRAYLVYREKKPEIIPELGGRVEAIASLHPSLRALLEVAQTRCTGFPTESVRLAQSGALNFTNILFVGNDSPFQILLRDRAEATWPTDLKDEILLARTSSIGRLLRSGEPWFRDVVVNLPILLAALMVTNSVNGWSEPHKLRALRKYQDFCPEWFFEAFDLTVARCIADQVIDGLRS